MKPYRADVTRHSSIEAPEGWTGNLRKVEGDIQREAGKGWAAAAMVAQYGWVYFACFPLRVALVARDACIKAPPIIRELIELHVGTHAVSGGRLFGLAKALEIVGAFFQQGRNASRAARNAGLQAEMKKIGVDSELTRSVEWLFDIANERFDVRHAWKKDSPGVALHPRMTHQELSDFVYNADLVVRAFVCERLGLETPMAASGDPPATGVWKDDKLEFSGHAEAPEEASAAK